jgi:predicted RNA-binding Zn-ribbon protein involved in translation (DUF1610 family)
MIRMDAPVPATQLLCTQCGGELHPDEGQTFLTCPYCGSTVYLDKSRVVFHWYLAATLDEPQARSSLARWMAGNQTVKDLDKKAQIVSHSFEYFPVWLLKVKLSNGSEKLAIEPAAATSISELRSINLPAGDLRKYDPNLEAQSAVPTVPMETAEAWLKERESLLSGILERSLVHIPLHTYKYTYKGNTYTAVVEGATGSVLANIYPAKAESPYLLAGGVTALVFLCLAAIPVAGYAADRSSGLGTGALICSGIGIVLAPILFAFAAWVAAKI